MLKKKKNELLIDLEKKFTISKNNAKEAFGRALININFINGRQYISFNDDLIQDINFEKNGKIYREHEVFNRIKPFRNTVISKIKDKHPIPRAISHSQSDEDLNSAKATNAMLSDLFKRQKMKKKINKVLYDVVDVGCSFLHIK